MLQCYLEHLSHRLCREAFYSLLIQPQTALTWPCALFLSSDLHVSSHSHFAIHFIFLAFHFVTPLWKPLVSKAISFPYVIRFTAQKQFGEEFFPRQPKLPLKQCYPWQIWRREQQEREMLWRKEVGDPELAASRVFTARGNSWNEVQKSDLLRKAVVLGSSQQKGCCLFRQKDTMENWKRFCQSSYSQTRTYSNYSRKPPCISLQIPMLFI